MGFPTNFSLARGRLLVGDSGGEVSRLALGTAGQSLTSDGSDLLWSSEGLQYTDTQLTNAQVMDLADTPITLVAAPGANKSICVFNAFVVADDAAGVWVEPSTPDDLVIEYADGTDIITGLVGADLVAVGVKNRFYTPAVAARALIANSAVRLFNTGGDWTGGNAANTMSVRVWYAVVDTIAFT